MISLLKNLSISREVRVAILAGILLAIGIVAIVKGYWLAGSVLFVVAAAIVATFLYFVVRPARVPRGAVLTVRLSGPISEDSPRSALGELIRRRPLSLYNLRYALEAAASDPGLRAVVVQIAGIDGGMATALELRRLLRAIHAGRKRVIALIEGDSAGLREYLVASGAGEIAANPDTMFTMLGVAAGNIFLKNALDKLKVQVQTLQWKEYKGAAETVSRDGMSPQLRESLEAVLADWQTILVEAIAEGRKLSPDRAQELAAAGFLSARAAIDAGLIDRIGYIEDVRAEFDPDSRRKVFVEMGRYFRHAIYTRERGRRPAIAVIHGVGPVLAGETPPTGEFMGGETTSEQIDRASRDQGVRAIVFRVNSPGGSAVGSDLVWRAVREAQGRGKPVVVSMGDVAGSGGYYVAMGADKIVAEAATITGSIGVVYAKPNLGDLMQNIGVHLEYAKTAAVGDAMSFSRAMSESELSQLNEVIGQVYANFTGKVSEGRKLPPDRTEDVARGRIWSGLAARRCGLVDEVGGFQKAVELARDLAQIPGRQAHQLVRFGPERGLFRLGFSFLRDQAPWWMGVGASALGIPARWAPAMLQLLARGGVMLLSPLIEL